MPAWKDEQTLYYSSDRDGRFRIYEQGNFSGVAQAVTNPAEGFAHYAPALTPDGRLAYSEMSLALDSSTGTAGLWIAGDAGDREQLVYSPRLTSSAAFARGSQAMAYVDFGAAGEGGARPAIFLTPYPPEASSAPTRVTSPDIVALNPALTGNGIDKPMRLLYQAPAELELVTADITIPGFEIANRRTLFANVNRGIRRAFAPIPGSDRVLVIVPEALLAGGTMTATSPRDIIVVRNLFEELETRVPAQ
jgi:hypothetical protein